LAGRRVIRQTESPLAILQAPEAKSEVPDWGIKSTLA
jgi:hypothetical protein